MKKNHKKTVNHPTYRSWVLVVMVMIAGFSQGTLLPVLAVMLENLGISSSANGFNAAGLYIGILLISPFLEKPVRRFGYKPVIIIGLLLLVLSLSLFPLWHAFWFWFVLRMIVGIGDNLIHFSTQVWISSTSSLEKRGRNLAIYGLAFGLGFGMGPLMTQLLHIHEALPFVLAAGASLLSWLLVLGLRNEWPENDIETTSQLNTFDRYKKVLSMAWFALLPGFGYGFLEASLNGNYPVYAMRNGIDLDWASILLSSFVFSSLITQIPLGMLSDRVDRGRVMRWIIFLGLITFLSMSVVETSMWALLGCFIIAGMLLGSLFSLGIAYLADLLPTSLLPTGNVMIAVLFALGSMTGPYLGGIFISWFGSGSVYYSISMMLFVLLIANFIFTHSQKNEEGKESKSA
ncbi:MFS transporter [Texcoconibacillus texcoconensis]|uniref:MFS family permease n=1 Tax=Texcoconibacillus texcoconensis TaxID=1095777 RepID=A0A840QTP2_9BACI|nr:MFS transporter [Texcoconibacillus texcoconensis]MBB5174668.1 MFS family permease [Texcoconibacillus texcoconensis]